MTGSDHIAPPPRFHQLLEGRVGAEISALMMQLPLLRCRVPKGQGRVMVLPGFMTDDSITWLLRRFLGSLGYDVEPWGLGVNRGAMMKFLPKMITRLEGNNTGQADPPSLVGWSRGGTLAREVARDRPDLVRSVITLGSPVRGGLNATSMGKLVQVDTGLTPEAVKRLLRERQKTPITVPITAIYSKTDGVVAWRACVDDVSPNIVHHEVRGSHSGLGFNAEVYQLVAKALAVHHGD